jgi:FkbM family methyltransferase
MVMNGGDTSVRVRFGEEELSFDGPTPDDYLLTLMRRTGRIYEEDLLTVLRRRTSNMRAGRTFVDIGAFIGTHSIFFARFCGAGRVLAFEPSGRSRAALDRNIAWHGLQESISVSSCAIGPGRGRGVLAESKTPNGGSTSVRARRGHAAATDALDVAIEPLDALIPDDADVGLIKIDVEGGEIGVLRGALRVIARSLPVLSIEIHPAVGLARVLWLLRPHGYIVTDCLGSSPNYVLVPCRCSALQSARNHFLWLAWAIAAKSKYMRPWLVRRAAQRSAERCERDDAQDRSRSDVDRTN